MDCEKVRDRFSSLWDKELTPFEERAVKEHLSSCPDCQKEFEQFEKTMRWLHSVGDVEVPDEFLPGLYKKMRERKEITSAEKSRKRWLSFPLPLKLPAQAVAMVAVIFLVLYLTKMMPMRGYHPKETGQPSSPLSLEKRPEQVLAQKEVKSERGNLKIAAEAPRPKDVEQAETAVPRKAEAPPSGTEVTKYQTFDLKGAARKKVPSSEGPEKIENGPSAQEKLALASKPAQEIVLKISDREKAISELHKLVKQFGGEIVTTEGDKFLASLPTGSFPQFEKELARLSSSTEADEAIMRKPGTGSVRALQEAKKEVVEGKAKEPAKLVGDEDSRMIVRILLVQE
ncbi:MAG TPA: zf-HC2 domain-containing protein [Thermodesulfobacteriota bacterium]|nr:zf-HC2 domain-containing protein [Thermodesulfobacteriota bacterium]